MLQTPPMRSKISRSLIYESACWRYFSIAVVEWMKSELTEFGGDFSTPMLAGYVNLANLQLSLLTAD
jgi:hypothetical protein